MIAQKGICSLGLKITAAVLTAQLVVFTFLFIVTDSFVSNSARESALNNMQTSAADRSEIIGNYIKSTGATLTAYLEAGQIYDLLNDTTDEEKTSAAQKYTEKFSGNLTNLEGIYASSWDTKVLTHTNSDVIGRVTRPDEEKRKPLHDAMLSTDGVYNAGIIISPASGEQIISMYKAVKDDNGTPIGLGGIGIFTNGLVEQLNALSSYELSAEARYFLVNINTGEYIFHPDKDKIATVAEEKFVTDIISQVREEQGICNSFSYTDENGDDMIAAFNDISEYGWIFIMSDRSSEVLSAAANLRIILIYICIASMLILAITAYYFISRMIYPLKSVERAVGSLGRVRLDAAEIVEKYTHRKDEVGNIANAVHALCFTLQNTTNDIRRILGEMANGNLAVDIEKNRGFYIGDFAILSENLVTIKSKLTEVITDIAVTAEQVNSGAKQVQIASNTLSEGSLEQSASIDLLAQEIKTIELQARTNSGNCVNARDLVDKTSDYAKEVNNKMESLTKAMNEINDASDMIRDVIKTVEDIAFQTNILSLNASIEASRSGEAGKGFAVVAEEVGNLARKSAEAVGDTAEIIDRAANAVNNGTNITKETVASMKSLNECTVKMKRIFDDISESGRQQEEMVTKITEEIECISDVVQTNTETAAESTSTSSGLSDQADMLKSLIDRFET